MATKKYARLRNPETKEEIVLASRTGNFETMNYTEVVEISALPPVNHDSLSMLRHKKLNSTVLHLNTFDSNASDHMQRRMS